MNQKKIILDFIKKHTIGVVSTVSPKNTPEAAVVEFGQTEDHEIIFDTLSDSRKYKNLQTNNYVALVIGWDEDITVQYEGQASELSGEELTKYKVIFFKKLPHARKWEKVKGIKFFKIVPNWIRYSDLRKHPWDVFEVRF